ncbi:MAG TPA: ArsI/CadI family heavy metal resistance metalloenzyme [Blastocatellia bacterium]|nr:ArsI/CadI family heavy metal resistance metalloenzyme [Blastocatellia bacterium]HMV84612.1 ArsI/CadI family heavy metal resistance metalloenzyme [Blastocatellia bacterium]HMX25015.1 ArsI/CadI family heavy metal resistance metalloenzyme [Blastocatellia bacterium]HMY74736.1 ArsI/CadI family heavy metal resistance metalloenzyme [Blastocatellia bacterium]HMZ20974.1 ArsI/CadI family heavy metal resistance metalloenzyme [Blastocatellia bacterium]
MTPKIHVALNVNNLEESLQFYRALWGIEPSKVRIGYAKFDVAEPPVNLTLNENPIKLQHGSGGVNHLGIQVGSTETVLAMRDRLVERGLQIALEENSTTCCFAVQDKVWVVDPNNYRWEVFVVHQDNLPQEAEPQVTACCVTGAPEMVKIGGVAR